jgi:acyl-CoA dehydrogenase
MPGGVFLGVEAISPEPLRAPMGSHPVTYDFFAFLDASRAARESDPILEAWLREHKVEGEALAWLEDVKAQVNGPLRETADFVERGETLPRLLGKGPYDNNPQQVVLPAETWDALSWVHASGLWDPELPDAARYAAVYLLNQNGEMGLNCSVACTDGLVRVLRRYPEDLRSRQVLETLEGASGEDWLHGAQFVTEIQGGSDAGSNAVTARKEGDSWSLWGQKWFCSNLTADYWLVTARPEGAMGGSGGVGLFCVPRDQPGYTVERLKDKLGTRALPTAEIVFRGAKGWAVGPLEKGLSTMVSEVLVTSRIHNVLAAAAFVRSAQREARAYAGFREAFGNRLESMPLIKESLSRLEHEADRLEAGAFATVDAWLSARAPQASADDLLFARVLVSLGKAVSTRRTPGLVYEAMMVLGGNGIEERFTLLPRLWRDSAILETWEGPYTLLLMNALQDLLRGGMQGKEREFLLHRLGDGDLADQAVRIVAQVLEDPTDERAIHLWPTAAMKLYSAWEEKAFKRLAHARG